MKFASLLIGGLGLAACLGAQAADMPTLRLELRTACSTRRASRPRPVLKFRLEIVNTGKTPVEFESTSCAKKSAGPSAQSSVVIQPPDAGQNTSF